MRSSVRLAKLLLAFGLATSWLAPRTASANEPVFAYVNANPNSQPNAIAGLLTTSDGRSTPVLGSPFATGGNGLAPVAGAEFAHRVAVVHPRDLLFAANDGSGSISVFNVDPESGVLAAVPGSPFKQGDGTAFSGISLAASNDGRFLYASASTVVSFFVDANGGLHEIGSRWSFAQRAGGIAVSADNSRVFLSMPGGIAILHSGEGGLSTDPPVFLSIGSTVTDLRTNASGSRIWVGTKDGGIGAYSYDSTNATLVSGAPFFLNVPDLSGVSVSEDGGLLFAYSPAGPRLLGARVNSNGSLALGPGSPLSPVLGPIGAALSPDGSFALLADGLGQFDVWSVGSDGTLAHLGGHPIATGVNPGFPSVASFPKTTPVPAAPIALLVLLAMALLCASPLRLRRL